MIRLDDSDEEKNKIVKMKKNKRKSSPSKPLKTYKKLKFDELEKYLDKDYNDMIEYR